MAKIIPITEHFQHFVEELKESFWGDLQGEAQRAAKKFLELLSERQRDRYMVNPRHGRSAGRTDHRNGYYLRDFVTRFGTLRLRIARSRKRGVPAGGDREVSAAGRGGVHAPPGSFSARDFDAPGGAGGGPLVLARHLLVGSHWTEAHGLSVPAIGTFGVFLFFVHTCLVLMYSMERANLDGPRWRAASMYAGCFVSIR
jgi:Transposase, Mutator family